MVHEDVEEAIAQMRRGVARLESDFMLWGKELDDDDLRAIAVELRVNTTLTSLDLGNDLISDAGAASLAEALKVNTALKELNISANSILDVGGASLAKALTVNTTLTKLDLGSNSIGDAGAASLADALRINNADDDLPLRQFHRRRGCHLARGGA
jgi:hypothetical protein